MNRTHYRYIIALTSIAMIGLCIVMLSLYNVSNIVSKIQYTYAQISNSKTTIVQENTVPKSTPISIEEIISKRYLYTLKKYIESHMSSLGGTGSTLGYEYSDFQKVAINGTHFIFNLGSTSIDIPTSSYFFDIWNQRSQGVVSGEVHINTGTTIPAHKKVIALTFDDGPSLQYTPILLDVLREEQVHATFYVLGSRVESYPQILKRAHDEGHEIGNHSYSHTLLTKLSESMVQEELYNTDQAIYNAIHIYPKTFRPPYGGINTGILEKTPMPAILWSIDPRDWQTHNKKKNIASIANAKDGDIIIMHDINEVSVGSIADMIKKLKGNGFTFVTISELLSLSGSNTESGKICTKKGKCK